MEGLSNEQRLQIVETYYQNSCSVKNVHRLRPNYGTAHTVFAEFRSKSTSLDIKLWSRMLTVHSKVNITAVMSSVNEDREMSIPRHFQQLNAYYSTT